MCRKLQLIQESWAEGVGPMSDDGIYISFLTIATGSGGHAGGRIAKTPACLQRVAEGLRVPNRQIIFVGKDLVSAGSKRIRICVVGVESLEVQAGPGIRAGIGTARRGRNALKNVDDLRVQQILRNDIAREGLPHALR